MRVEPNLKGCLKTLYAMTVLWFSVEPDILPLLPMQNFGYSSYRVDCELQLNPHKLVKLDSIRNFSVSSSWSKALVVFQCWYEERILEAEFGGNAKTVSIVTSHLGRKVVGGLEMLTLPSLGLQALNCSSVLDSALGSVNILDEVGAFWCMTQYLRMISVIKGKKCLVVSFGFCGWYIYITSLHYGDMKNTCGDMEKFEQMENLWW
jgi:hypothetical protein